MLIIFFFFSVRFLARQFQTITHLPFFFVVSNLNISLRVDWVVKCRPPTWRTHVSSPGVLYLLPNMRNVGFIFDFFFLY